MTINQTKKKEIIVDKQSTVERKVYSVIYFGQ